MGLLTFALAGAGAAGTVAAAPLVLTAVGFTGAGIAASSCAAWMMSTAAVANGGGVAAGSAVAVLQAAGTAGIPVVGQAAVGATGAAVGTILGLLI
ncbi:interferon alpha-inducible protein 27-like protein 2A [Pseudorasbora parva]|uniref:interferon alpha-inducible protein 27-like protein 2A n=1 Tax=Pseudorasbora parva TaxID=51549 RepID=UPI00351F12E1